VASGQINWVTLLVLLHGIVFVLCAVWLAKRHHNVSLLDLPRRFLAGQRSTGAAA
jgi:hypothetical protein